MSRRVESCARELRLKLRVAAGRLFFHDPLDVPANVTLVVGSS